MGSVKVADRPSRNSRWYLKYIDLSRMIHYNIIKIS